MAVVGGLCVLCVVRERDFRLGTECNAVRAAGAQNKDGLGIPARCPAPVGGRELPLPADRVLSLALKHPPGWCTSLSRHPPPTTPDENCDRNIRN